MDSMHILEFCRYVLLITFSISALSKIRQFDNFKSAIRGFGLIPENLIIVVSGGFLLLEIAITVNLLFQENDNYRIGFIIAGINLCLFTAALISVLVRGYRVECGCFGTSEQVSYWDVLRNGILLTFVIIGYSLIDSLSIMSLSNAILILILAGILVEFLLNLNSIYRLYSSRSVL